MQYEAIINLINDLKDLGLVGTFAKKLLILIKEKSMKEVQQYIVRINKEIFRLNNKESIKLTCGTDKITAVALNGFIQVTGKSISPKKLREKQQVFFDCYYPLYAKSTKDPESKQIIHDGSAYIWFVQLTISKRYDKYKKTETVNDNS